MGEKQNPSSRPGPRRLSLGGAGRFFVFYLGRLWRMCALLSISLPRGISLRRGEKRCCLRSPAADCGKSSPHHHLFVIQSRHGSQALFPPSRSHQPPPVPSNAAAAESVRGLGLHIGRKRCNGPRLRLPRADLPSTQSQQLCHLLDPGVRQGSPSRWI